MFWMQQKQWKTLEDICNFIFNLTVSKSIIAIVLANQIKSLSGNYLEMPQFLELTQQAILHGKEEIQEEAEAQTFLITPVARLSDIEMKQTLFL